MIFSPASQNCKLKKIAKLILCVFVQLFTLEHLLDWRILNRLANTMRHKNKYIFLSVKNRLCELIKGKKKFSLKTSKDKKKWNKRNWGEKNWSDLISFRSCFHFFFAPTRCGIKSVSDCINMIFAAVISALEDGILHHERDHIGMCIKISLDYPSLNHFATTTRCFWTFLTVQIFFLVLDFQEI